MNETYNFLISIAHKQICQSNYQQNSKKIRYLYIYISNNLKVIIPNKQINERIIKQSKIIKIDRILFCSNQKITPIQIIQNKSNKKNVSPRITKIKPITKCIVDYSLSINKVQELKIPTHFTIPQENESKKLVIKNMGNKLKAKKSLQDKQYRKLNKQSKKVKSLQEQYRELEEQIKQVKQMVQLQLQLINHTSSDNAHDDISNNSNKQPYSIEKVQQVQQQITQKNNLNNLNNNLINDEKVDTRKLQQLINTLFSYQETIQTANSNYLLLSQVNKQEQSQSLFQINSLQDRIRQLRFLLNNKEDLLAYEMATIDSVGLANNGNNNDNVIEDDQDDKPICIDYHMPKKMTMANQHNMDSQFRLVQRAVVEMGRLRLNVKSLQEQLRDIQKENGQQVKKNNNKQNDQQEYEEQQKKVQTHLIPSPLTTRATPQSAISKANYNHSNHTNNNLQYLPLSTTNYKNSLIYKVAKLNDIQQQRGEQLKSTYSNLLKQYNQQVQRKKHLVSQYQIQRDIYQYKKRQVLANNNKGCEIKNSKRNTNKMLLNQIQEQEILSQNQINVENILAELHSQQQENEEKQKEKYHNEVNINTQCNTPTTTNIFTVRSSSTSQQVQTQSASSTTTTTNFYTLQSSPSSMMAQTKSTSQQNINHNHYANTGLFNEITNTPQKQKQTVNKNNMQTNNNSSPFLKLKLKSTFYQHKTSSSSSSSSQKNNNQQQQSTLSRFSLNKNHDDKENSSTGVVKKLTFNLQEKQTSTQNQNPSTFNTPTKRRRPYNINKEQSNTISSQFSNIKVQNC